MYSLKNKELDGISITSVRNKNKIKIGCGWTFLEYKTREAKNGENTSTQI